jgi:hypothetical protein
MFVPSLLIDCPNSDSHMSYNTIILATATNCIFCLYRFIYVHEHNSNRYGPYNCYELRRNIGLQLLMTPFIPLDDDIRIMEKNCSVSSAVIESILCNTHYVKTLPTPMLRTNHALSYIIPHIPRYLRTTTNHTNLRSPLYTQFLTVA